MRSLNRRAPASSLSSDVSVNSRTRFAGSALWPASRALDHVRHVGRARRSCRQVHRDRVPPAGELGGPVRDPLVDLEDQADLLRSREKLARRDDPAPGARIRISNSCAAVLAVARSTIGWASSTNRS